MKSIYQILGLRYRIYIQRKTTNGRLTCRRKESRIAKNDVDYENLFDYDDFYTAYNTKNHPALAVGLQGVFSTVEDIVSTEVATKRTTAASTVNVWYRTLVEGDAYLVEAYVVGKQGDTNRASYVRRALVYRTIGGNAIMQGTVDNVSTKESDTSWDCTMDVNAGNTRVRITGKAATQIDWKASVRVIPVMD